MVLILGTDCECQVSTITFRQVKASRYDSNIRAKRI